MEGMGSSMAGTSMEKKKKELKICWNGIVVII